MEQYIVLQNIQTLIIVLDLKLMPNMETFGALTIVLVDMVLSVNDNQVNLKQNAFVLGRDHEKIGILNFKIITKLWEFLKIDFDLFCLPYDIIFTSGTFLSQKN